MLQRVCEPRLVTAGRTLYGVSSFAALVATRVLYMEERRGQDPDPCYAREFDARILERGPDFVVLDQTLFYAEGGGQPRSEEHTSELQSQSNLVCRLLLVQKKTPTSTS